MSAKCPRDSDLVRLAAYETSHEESDGLFRHLADCPRCSTRFAVLREVKRDLRPAVESFAREFDADRAGPLLANTARRKLDVLGSPPPPSQPPPQARPSASSRLPRLFGLAITPSLVAGALAVLAVVASGIYLTATRSEMYSRLRSPADGLTLVEPAGRVPRAPAVFRWTPVANAESYLLELYDESLARVHLSSAYLINELVLPAEVKGALVENRTYLWTVSAFDGDSALLASESGTFVIE